MTKPFCEIFAALLILALLPAVAPAGSASAGEAGPQAQDIAPGDFKIKVDVTLVTTDVTVINPAVPELRADDFLLFCFSTMACPSR